MSVNVFADPRIIQEQAVAGGTGPTASDGPPKHLANVLVADAGGPLRGALLPALKEHADCRILHARSVAEIEGLVSSGMVGDLALVNVQFHGNSPIVIRVLRAAGWSRVIALTNSGIPVALTIAAINAGASGVLSIPEIAPEVPRPVYRLTLREMQVVSLVADGRSNRVIAERLSISALTVKNHMARIGRKMGVGDRAQIVAIACRSGILTDPPGRNGGDSTPRDLDDQHGQHQNACGPCA